MSNRVRLWTVIKAAGALAAFFVIWMASATLLVVSTARGRTYADLASIPKRDVGLVLGCSRFLPDGRRNRFFDNRIRAASDLYRAGKIDYLVVSGDNHVRGYDEPTDMKKSLIEAGVPPERIYCDYAGFRTSGVDVIGFNAPEVDAYDSFKTKCRELMARANMLLDLFVVRRGPKILGEPFTLPT
jgi:SanA protein